MVVRAAAIAALYVGLTIPFGNLAYGPVQFRIAEALTILPIFFVEAIPGVAIGCLISNMLVYGPIDMVVGTLSTLIAALLTRRLRKIYFAVIPPILINAFSVPLMLLALGEVGGMSGYFLTVLTVGAGQAAVIIGLGVPLYFSVTRLLKNGTISRSL